MWDVKCGISNSLAVEGETGVLFEMCITMAIVHSGWFDNMVWGGCSLYLHSFARFVPSAFEG